VDLNTLIPSNSGFYLLTAEFIADNGEIAALGLLANGDQHAVLLIPCDENHPGVERCDYSLVEEKTTATVSTSPATGLSPDATRHLLRSVGSTPWRHRLEAQPQK